MSPSHLSEITARLAREGDGGGPSVLRRECTPLPWIEAKISARPDSDDEGAPVTLAFPPGGGGDGRGGGVGGGGGAVLLCGGAGGGNAAMQAEGQAFQAAVAVEVQLVDQWEVVAVV